MNPKEYMEEADRLRRRIHRKENEIRSLRAAAEGITGMSSSDMPKTASPNPHKMEAAVCKIISLEKEVEEIKAELDNLMTEIYNEIQQVADSDARDLLTKRYLEFKPWKIIMAEMSYSESSCYRLHRYGLAAMKKLTVADSS